LRPGKTAPDFSISFIFYFSLLEDIIMTEHKKSGFTLIELLIVVAIIGILAAIAIPNFLQAQTRAKVAEAKQEMRTLGTGLEAYRVDNPGYPMISDLSGLFGYLRRLEILTKPVSYLTSIPEDPFAKATMMVDPSNPYNDAYNYPYYTSSGNKPKPWTYDYSCLGYLKDRGYDWSNTLSSFPGISWLTVRWGMHSAGPDSSWDPFNQSTPILIYDPTNGTTSDGDIWLIGPGHGFADK